MKHNVAQHCTQCTLQLAQELDFSFARICSCEISSTHPPDFTSRALRLVSRICCRCFCRLLLSRFFRCFRLLTRFDVFIPAFVVQWDGFKQEKSHVGDVVPLPAVCLVIWHVSRVFHVHFVQCWDCSNGTSHVWCHSTNVFVFVPFGVGSREEVTFGVTFARFHPTMKFIQSTIAGMTATRR